MLKNIKASLIFWSVLSFVLVFMVFLTSRVYVINFWVSFKILFAVIFAYNVLGLVLSIFSFTLDKIVNLFSPGNKKDFRWWLFGAVHGGTAVYISSFYYLNKVLQPNTYILSFSGLAANAGLILLGVVIGGLALLLSGKLPVKFWRWSVPGLFVIYAAISIFMSAMANSYNSKPHADKSVPVQAEVKQKVFLFGVDGASWDVLDPLIENGEAPNFAKLVNEGYSDRFKTIRPTSSPIIWTSIATGKTGKKHGIVDVVFTVVPGLDNAIIHFPHFLAAKLASEYLTRVGVFYSVPVSSSIRQTKALWNINTDYGLTTEVIGWWGSWPPDSIQGNIVSDHASILKQDVRVMKGQLKINEDFGYDRQSKTWPPELEEELSILNQDLQEVTIEDVNRYFEADSAMTARVNNIEKWEKFDFGAGIKFGCLTDKFYHLSAKHLLAKEEWDCFMLYLNQIDIMEHYFWMYYDDDPGLIKIYGDYPFENVVPNAYKVIDSILGEILESLDENTTIIVVSDHGFETFTLPSGIVICDHTQAPDGILLAYGPNITNKKIREGKHNVYDVTPTILTLLGIPLGKDMDGKVMSDIFDSRFLEENPIALISSHDSGYKYRKYVTTESEFDNTSLDKFKALGYVK